MAFLKEMQWLGIFTQRLDCVGPAGEICSLVIVILQNNQSFLIDTLISRVLSFPKYNSIDKYVYLFTYTYNNKYYMYM